MVAESRCANGQQIVGNRRQMLQTNTEIRCKVQKSATLLALGSWLLALGFWFLVFGFLKIADLFLTLDLEKPFKIAIPAQAGIHDCASYCDGFPPARE